MLYMTGRSELTFQLAKMVSSISYFSRLPETELYPLCRLVLLRLGHLLLDVFYLESVRYYPSERAAGYGYASARRRTWTNFLSGRHCELSSFAITGNQAVRGDVFRQESC